MKSLAAVAGMVATLGLAGWFDYLYDTLRLTPAKNAVVDPGPLVWLGAVTSAVLAGLLLLLAWFVMIKDSGSRLVFVSFLIVGLLVLFSYFLQAPLSGLPPFLWQLFSAFLPASPRSLLFHASALIAVIGLMGLVVRRRP